VSENRLRVLILGGYGKFGGQLAELLCDERRLTLIIAGRSQAKASVFCRKLPPGAAREAEAVDRDGDVEVRLKEIAPDIVVDASGPFQGYGDDPYRVANAAVAIGCHYVDFADGSDFVHGIAQFDEAARNAGLVVLSGVSSFPALTAAVVRHLSSDLVRVSSIFGGIAPTPYAGVGLSVVSAIAGYAGQEVSVRSNGEVRSAYALTETRHYTIGPPGLVPLDRLVFSLVDVPDLESLPELWPDVRTVWMGAGPVPAIIHRMLRGLAYLVRWGVIPSLAPFSRVLFHANNILRWGEHRGGMFVEVEGERSDGQTVTRAWHLLAEDNDGTFIPSMAIETLIRNWVAGASPAYGARVATREIELADYEKLFVHRQIYAGQRGEEYLIDHCLYGRVLGDAWKALPASIQFLHGRLSGQTATGKATVTRGTGLVARMVANGIGFPRAAVDVDVAVSFEQSGEAERWTRTFGAQVLTSHQFAGTGRFERLLCERFGPFVFGLALVVDSGKLIFVVRRWTLFGIPMPRFLAPNSKAFEFDEDGTFHFDVEVRAPLAGLIVRYAGYLEPQ
jgi:saccharopine dehydrogenase-like NADP-dependent oxidoreductase